MTLKRCSCGRLLTTRNADFLGSMQLDPAQPRILLFNCRACRSTLAIGRRVSARRQRTAA